MSAGLRHIAPATKQSGIFIPADDMDTLALGVLRETNDSPAGRVIICRGVFPSLGRNVAVICTVLRRLEIVCLVAPIAISCKVAEIAVNRSATIEFGPAELDPKNLLRGSSPPVAS